MELKKLYQSSNGITKVAGMISGGGSNLIKIIEHGKKLEVERGKSPYEVSAIFSNDLKSNALKIGLEYGIPVVVRDIGNFCKERGKLINDLSIRGEFDEGIISALKQYKINVAAYAGYMSIASQVLINAFLGVNVHPADLSIMNEGKRKYTGAHAVRDAILSGEKQLRSTTHIIEPEVDYGKILMISRPIDVIIPEGFDPQDKEQVKKVEGSNQDILKTIGDWEIFPKTLEYIADGRYSKDEQGNLYFDGKAIPNGLRLE